MIGNSTLKTTTLAMILEVTLMGETRSHKILPTLQKERLLIVNHCIKALHVSIKYCIVNC